MSFHVAQIDHAVEVIRTDLDKSIQSLPAMAAGLVVAGQELRALELDDTQELPLTWEGDQV